jgi:hypothetical protein
MDPGPLGNRRCEGVLPRIDASRPVPDAPAARGLRPRRDRVAVRVDRDDLERIDVAAARAGTTRSRIIRACLSGVLAVAELVEDGVL